MLSPDTVFQTANTVALLSWIALIALPRWEALLAGLVYGVVAALCAVYAGLIFAAFFTVEGGGFDSVDAVAALFENRWLLVAGWLHFLAFDLFIGVWIARRSDAIGLSRLAQAPILVAAFMLGPLGLLLFFSVAAAFGARAFVMETDR